MVLAITQARMSSTRLPGKVMMEIDGKTLLELHVSRIRKSQKIHKHVVAISDSKNDDVLETFCKTHNIECYRGSENDVLDRFHAVCKIIQPKHLVRLTADCPLIDAAVVDRIIDMYATSNCDYVSNTLHPSFPDGLDAEVFSFKVLERAWKEASLISDREHVTPYLWRNSDLKGGNLFTSKDFRYDTDYSQFRLTVDEKEDFLLIEKLVKELGHERPWIDYINFIIKNNINLNARFLRNEGYTQSLKKDQHD